MALAFVLTLLVVGLVMVMMAFGVLLGKRPLEAECKVLERLADQKGVPLCSACEEAEGCPLKKTGLIRSPTSGP